MTTYAEYLKSQGATDEDVKLLDTPLGRKTYESMLAAQAETAAQKTKSENYQTQVDQWYETEKEKRARIENDLIASQSREAAVRTALKAAHDKGMLDIKKDLGFDLDAPIVPAAKKEDTVDTSKFATRDDILSLSERAGDGLALMQDIVGEHAQLFPDRPLRVRELRAAAVAAKMSVEEYWMKQYDVPRARETRDRTAKEAYEKRLREEGMELARKEFADKYGNPDVRPLVESRSFLTPRKESGRDGAKQPWDAGTELESGSNDRVRRATQNALKAQVTTH